MTGELSARDDNTDRYRRGSDDKNNGEDYDSPANDRRWGRAVFDVVERAENGRKAQHKVHHGQQRKQSKNSAYNKVED